MATSNLVLRLKGSYRRHGDIWLLAGIVLAAALLRILLLLPGRVVWGDEPSYLWLGRNWITGRGFTFTGHPDPHHSPLYPMVTGLLFLVTHDLELASDIYYVLFGSLLAVPIFLLARRIYGRTTGLWAALVVSFYPALTGAVLFWGTMTEPIYYFLVYLGFWFALLAAEENRLWAFAATSAALALAYLCRPEAIGYLAAALLFWGLVWLAKRQLFWWRSLGALALYGLVFLIIFFPYAAFVHSQTGSWQVTEKAGVTFVTCLGLASHDVVAFDQATWGLDSTGHEVFFFSPESYNVSMSDYVREHPHEFAQMVVGNLRDFQHYLLSRRMFPSFLLAVVALAFFATPWDRLRLQRELLLWLTVLPLLGFVLFFIQERYIGAALPTLAIWLAAGLQHLGQWLAATWANLVGVRTLPALQDSPQPQATGFSGESPMGDAPLTLRKGGVAALPVKHWAWTVGRLLVVLPFVAALVWFLVYTPTVIRGTSLGSYRFGHKSVGLWLHERVPREAVVMSRYPAIAFYADTTWRPTPNASIQEMLEYARYKQVDYWVLDEGETARMRPQYRPLLDGSTLPAPLERIHVDRSDGQRLVVFRFNW